MSKIYRKISWLLLLAMLFGMLGTGVYAAGVTPTILEVKWSNSKDAAPDGVASVKLDLYEKDKEDKLTSSPLVVNKTDSWKLTGLTGLSLDTDKTYIAKITDGGEALKDYGARVSFDTSNQLVVTLFETVSVTVQGAWNDGENQDGLRPTAMNVTLYNGTEKTDNTVPLNADNSWKHTFTGLDKKGTWTAKVADGDGYTYADTVGQDGEITVTGSHSPTTMNVKVNVVWNDVENQDNLRPETLSVQLYNGETASGEPVTVKAADSWSYTYARLSKDGQWSVKVSDGAGYTYAVAPIQDGVVTVTGTHATASATKNLSVKLVWADGENQDGLRPEEFKIQLYNGETVSGEPATVKADDQGNWGYTYADLSGDGTWSVKAVAVPEGYAADVAVEGDNVTITCAHTPATVDYTVTLDWNDGNDQLKQRPASAKVQLYRVDTTAEGNKRVDVGTPVTIEQNTEGKWVYTFTGLPKNAAGTAITYKFELVDAPAKYTASYSYTTGTVKLTNDYKNNTTMNYKVTAKWVDNNNKYKKRPASITVTLYANGTKAKTVTIKPDSNGNWNYTFENVAEYKDAQKVNYEVKVSAVSNYVSKVSYATSNGVTTATITNTYSDIPLTGDSTNMIFWMVLALVAGVSLIGAVGFRHCKGA